MLSNPHGARHHLQRLEFKRIGWHHLGWLPGSEGLGGWVGLGAEHGEIDVVAARHVATRRVPDERSVLKAAPVLSVCPVIASSHVSASAVCPPRHPGREYFSSRAEVSGVDRAETTGCKSIHDWFLFLFYFSPERVPQRRGTVFKGDSGNPHQHQKTNRSRWFLARISEPNQNHVLVVPEFQGNARRPHSFLQFSQ